MQFLQPSFLWVLGVLAIPILIHLFHFRRFKKVYFTNVHLLKEIKEETSTRNKLRNLLILLARCLALGMLVLAFAQPFIKKGDANDAQHRAVEIIIDNSFSMEAREAEVPLLTLAKDRALEIIDAHKESDQFLILTHDLEAKHQRYVDQKTAREFVSEMTVTPSVETLASLTNIIDRIRDRITDHAHHLYILSDFQENISSFETKIDTSINTYMIPFRAIQETNVSIENASWLAPIAMKDQTNTLVATLYNHSDEDQVVELRMTYEGQERPLGSISLPPRSSVYDSITVNVNRTGWHELKLSIDDYPVAFDNDYYVAFNIKENIQVTNIFDQGANSFLTSAFESISYYNLNQVPRNAIKFESFAEQELIILNDLQNISSGLASELEKYVRSGGNLLIFPGNAANANSYNSLLGSMGTDRLGQLLVEKREVGSINQSEFVFNNVYQSRKKNIRLPITARNYKMISQQSSGKERLLTYRDGQPFLQKFIVNKGHVYLCAAPLDGSSSDLVSNAEVFVPMLYKMALSTGFRAPLAYTIGQQDLISLTSVNGPVAERYTMKGPNEFIPAVSTIGNNNVMDVRNQIKESGQYSLNLEDRAIETFAFNYDRTESEVTYGDLNTIGAQMSDKVEILNDVAMANISDFISQRTEGIKLWRWCLILGLLFLLLETALIRFWK